MTNQIKSGGEREPWARPDCTTCGGWGYVYAIPRDGGEPYRCSCGNCQAHRDKPDNDVVSYSARVASTSQGVDGRHTPNLSRTPAKAGEDGVERAHAAFVLAAAKIERGTRLDSLTEGEEKALVKAVIVALHGDQEKEQ